MEGVGLLERRGRARRRHMGSFAFRNGNFEKQETYTSHGIRRKTVFGPTKKTQNSIESSASGGLPMTYGMVEADGILWTQKKAMA